MSWVLAVKIFLFQSSTALVEGSVLDLVYEQKLFEAHALESFEIAALASAHRNSFDGQAILFGCGPLSSLNQQETSFSIHSNYVEIATVHHQEQTACLVSQISHPDFHQNVQVHDDWSFEYVPPVLKIHQSVMDYLPHLSSAGSTHSQQQRESEERERINPYPSLVEGIPSPEGMALVIQFVRSSHHLNGSAPMLAEILRGWKSHSVDPQSRLSSVLERGNGRWRTLMTEAAATAPSSASSASGSSLDIDSKLHLTRECRLPSATASSVEYERWVARLVDLSGWANSSPSAEAPHSSLSLYCFLSLVETIAAHSSVLSVTLQGRPVLLNYEAKPFTQSGSSSTPFSNAGIYGSGQIVGVADSGLDDFSCYFWDNSGAYSNPATARSSYLTPSLERNRRKVVQYTAYADSMDTNGGHGTHVVGTIVGSAIFEDFEGGNGLAPAAKVAFYDIMDSNSPYLSIPDTYTYLYPTLYNAGARVLSNSWGSYASESKSSDDIL
jgi:hypothetical protein